MHTKIIVSKNNPLVKEHSALKEKKFREKNGCFLVEGEKMVRECVKSGLKIRRLIMRDDYTGKEYGFDTVILGADAFRCVCDEKTPQGIAAEVEIPRQILRKPLKPCLILDGVSDPANVGAIIRTAVAAGYLEIYGISCADPYSPNSVRASMSGVFFANIMQGTRDEIISALQGVPFIAADMDGENVFQFTPPELFALCIGNEGRGLSDEIFSRADHTVKIPMGSQTESLNAAVSAGILMYQLKKTEMLKRS